MLSIEKNSPPKNTFLESYLINGNYVDCYSTTIDKKISFSEFIFAFYTTWLFNVEAFILTYTVRKPSSDIEAKSYQMLKLINSRRGLSKTEMKKNY